MGDPAAPPPGAPHVADGTDSNRVGRSSEDLQAEVAQRNLHNRIERDFTYHPPVNQTQTDIYTELRERARMFGHFLIDVVPNGRELARALSDLEDCVMHANSGIARNPEHYKPTAAVDFEG